MPRNEEVKSMDRHSRLFTSVCTVAMMGMVLTSAGCRSMKNEVPPGKPYSTTGGGAPPQVGFNSDPHPGTSIGPGVYGNGMTPSAASTDNGPVGAPQYGTPTPNASTYGAPSNNKFGSLPGTMIPPSLNNN
jgi:hypothetical protein